MRIARVGTAVALLAMSNACSWKSIVERPAVPSLAAHPSSSVIELVDKDGRRAQLTPSTTLQFILRNGDVTEAFAARSLCRSSEGIFVADGDCAHGKRVAAWDDISAVEVEGFDAAGSTFAAIGITAAGLAVFTVLALLRAPQAPPIPLPARDGDDARSYGREPWDVRPLTPPTPFFTNNARRRSIVSISLGLETGTCVYDPATPSGAIRAGFRLVDYVELTGGVRWIARWAPGGGLTFGGTQDVPTRWTPTGGIGVHASFPRFRQLAFYLGFEAGGGSDSIQFFFAARPGLRYSVIPELAIGLFPFSPTFISDGRPGLPSGFQASTSLEVSTAF